MPSFSFHYANHEFLIDLKPWSGEEQVYVDANRVSFKQQFEPSSEHEFELPDIGSLRLIFTPNYPAQQVSYQLEVNGDRVQSESLPLVIQVSSSADTAGALEASAADAPTRESLFPQGSMVSMGAIAFKLLKAFKVVKVALLASSVAVYSMLFTVEYALALVGILIFHEYGHLRAMKKFGIPTKGMYLIPFVGGIAVGDKPKTQWQDVYISMMGPVFGLVMTVIFYAVYLLTENHFAGLVASTSALLNLFNLIPVYPLDGGRVVKALVFSVRNYLALVALLAISAVCFVGAWKLGLFFITFFIVLGVIDIVAGWRAGLAEDIPPLKPYGIWYSVVWYLLVVATFIGMIIMIAKDRLPGSEIAMKVLSS